MKFVRKELPTRMKVVRLANIAGLIIIVLMFAFNKDRFRAMLHPESDDIVGRPAPEFAQGTWFNSPPLTLQKLRGKIVVVDFWTFRCRNCVNVLPDVLDWHRKYKDRGVAVVAVHSPETEEEASLDALGKFIADNDIEYPVVTDNTFTMWNRYRVQFWPSTFVIDRDGVVRTFHYGELGVSSVKDDIEELLTD